MSKVFEDPNHEGSFLEVRAREAGGISVRVNREVTCLDTATAAEAALDILEKAYGDRQPAPTKVGEAWAALYTHIADEEQATAEAKEREELGVEALAFLNAARESTGNPAVATWDGFDGVTQLAYLAIAKKARELAGK